MSPRTISVLTLGVEDLSRSSDFYESLGFRRSLKSDEHIVWFATGGTVLALYHWDDLADDLHSALRARDSAVSPWPST